MHLRVYLRPDTTMYTICLSFYLVVHFLPMHKDIVHCILTLLCVQFAFNLHLIIMCKCTNIMYTFFDYTLHLHKDIVHLLHCKRSFIGVWGVGCGFVLRCLGCTTNVHLVLVMHLVLVVYLILVVYLVLVVHL